MNNQKSHRKTLITLGVVIVIMFGFCFAMVPLYSLFCRATGINTTVRTELNKPSAGADSSVDLSREVTVQFLAMTNQSLPWDFYPLTKSIKVHPGANTRVAFYVKNKTNRHMIVQAVPSMTPSESIANFHKIECFCFRQQALKPGESKDMALVFQVDKKLPSTVHTITLAYTLFDATPKEEKKA